MDGYWRGASAAGLAAALVLFAVFALIAAALWTNNPTVRKKNRRIICCPGPTGAAGPAGSTGPTGAASGTGGSGGGAGMIFFSSNNVNIQSGNLIGTGWIVNAIQEFSAAFVVPRNTTLSRLYVYLSSAPSLSSTRRFTIRVNGVDTGLTVLISGTSTVGIDLVDTVNVLAGDQISLQTVSTGTPAAATCEASVQYL
jgi:hypothetical protein